MIQNLIKLDDVTARDVMTPRVVVASAPENLTMKDFYAQKQYCNYSRIPVYNNDRDNITGYVLRQTILEKLAEDKFDMQLKEIIRPILAFPETSEVSVLWEKMLEQKEHISVIIDEYGSLQGIVTMEDIKKERQLELCMEGVRFLDLKRWGDAPTALADKGRQIPTFRVTPDPSNDYTTAEGVYNAKYDCSVEWTDNDYNYEASGWTPNRDEYLPYPQDEMNANSQLVQNPGY